MKIVFHGHNAHSFRAGIEARLPPGLSLVDLPDLLTDPADRAHYANAEVVVGERSVMSYLLWPLTKGLNEAIREP